MLSFTAIAQGAAERLSIRRGTAMGAWALRLFVMQRRLRSTELAQILVCALFGALVGAMVAGLHTLVDVTHRFAFNLSTHSLLSAGIGIDPQRILIVPAVGGLALARMSQR
jgi:hypothetical protein